MTIQTVHAGHHISPRAIALGLAAAGLAAAAGYGIAATVLDEDPATTTQVGTGAPDLGGQDLSRLRGFDDPAKFGNTNREARVLMHRS